MSSAKVGKGSGWAVAVGSLLLAGGVAGCANTVGRSERFEHAELGYSVPYPQQVDPSQASAWREVRVKDADIAFRGPSDAFVAISSRCDESQTDPAVLGRQLLIGLQNRTRLASERFEFAGGLAYSQVVEASEGDHLIRTKTVTLVRGGCVVDWVLVATGFPPEVEETFDSWWQGFDPGAMPGSAEGPAEIAP